jgi:hypothetical protein
LPAVWRDPPAIFEQLPERRPRTEPPVEKVEHVDI